VLSVKICVQQIVYLHFLRAFILRIYFAVIPLFHDFHQITDAILTDIYPLDSAYNLYLIKVKFYIFLNLK